MQQRAGLLFLSKTTSRILLILEDQKWTVPTFARNSTLLDDAKQLMSEYAVGRILPIELYLSEDRGFEYGTYVCLTDKDVRGSWYRMPILTLTALVDFFIVRKKGSKNIF